MERREGSSSRFEVLQSHPLVSLVAGGSVLRGTDGFRASCSYFEETRPVPPSKRQQLL